MKKILSFVTCSLLLSSCGSTLQNNGVSVAATFYPLAFIAEQVGESHVTVAQITPSGVEPHDYEPSPQELVVVHSAKVFLANGSGLDPWAEKIKNELTAKGIIVLTATDTIDLLPSGEEHEDEEAEHEEGEEEYSAFDPHIWLDPILMQELTVKVRDALISVDSAHTEDYRSNATSFIAKLETLDTEYEQGLASCELREIVTSHNAFSYLGHRYGFTVLSISGISPEDEPSAKHLAEIADLAQSKNIDMIFFETLVSPKLSETIASEIGAKTAVLNPIEGISDEERKTGEDYISLMEENLTQLRAALRCQ